MFNIDFTVVRVKWVNTCKPLRAVAHGNIRPGVFWYSCFSTDAVLQSSLDCLAPDSFPQWSISFWLLIQLLTTGLMLHNFKHHMTPKHFPGKHLVHNPPTWTWTCMMEEEHYRTFYVLDQEHPYFRRSLACTLVHLSCLWLLPWQLQNIQPACAQTPAALQGERISNSQTHLPDSVLLALDSHLRQKNRKHMSQSYIHMSYCTTEHLKHGWRNQRTEFLILLNFNSNGCCG